MKTTNDLILSRVIAPRKDDEHLLSMALIGYMCDENDQPLHAVSIDCEPPLLGMPYFKLYSPQTGAGLAVWRASVSRRRKLWYRWAANR